MNEPASAERFSSGFWRESREAAEYPYEVRNVESGRTYSTAKVQVVEVRDGRIARSRDCHAHLVLARAAGRAANLLDALRDALGTWP